MDALSPVELTATGALVLLVLEKILAFATKTMNKQDSEYGQELIAVQEALSTLTSLLIKQTELLEVLIERSTEEQMNRMRQAIRAEELARIKGNSGNG